MATDDSPMQLQSLKNSSYPSLPRERTTCANSRCKICTMSKDPPAVVDEEGSEVVVDPNEDEVVLPLAVALPVEVLLVAELLVEVVQLPLVAAVLPPCEVPPEVALPLLRPSLLATMTTTAAPAVEVVLPAMMMATAAGEDMKSPATVDRETDSITVEEAVLTAVEDRVLVLHMTNTAATTITVKAGAATATVLGP